MSDATDKDNADAKQDANGDNGIGGAHDAIDALKPANAGTDAQKRDAEQAKQTAQDDLDGAIEDINAGRIRAADRRMNKAIKGLSEHKWTDGAAGTDAIKAKLNHAKKAKRKITQPAVPGAVSGADVAYAMLLALLNEASGGMLPLALTGGPFMLAPDAAERPVPAQARR